MDQPAAPRFARLAYACLGAAVCMVFVAWTRGDWGGHLAARAYVDVASTAAAAGAGLLAFRRARKLRPVRHLPWIFLGLGCLAWAAGNLVYAYYELVAQVEVPLPSLADVGYLLMLPFMAGALLLLVVGVSTVTSRLRMLLDGLFIATAFLFMARALVLRPLLAYAGQQETTVAKIVALAYPLGDLAVAALLLLVLTRANQALRRTLYWLGAALLAITTADLGYWYLTAIGTYTTGAPTDLGWILGFMLVGYAALRPIPPLVPTRAVEPGPLLTSLPLGPFIVATLVALYVEVHEGALEPFLFWNAIVVIALLVTRQFLVLLENQALRQVAEDSARDLARSRDERTAMLNSVTHDIMGPMSAIRLQVRLLRNVDLPPPSKASLEVLARSTDQVIRMAQDLKDLANAESGGLKMVPVAMDLARTLREAVAARQAMAAEFGVAVTAQAEAPLPVTADPDRMLQVLDNLVHNAIRFTPKGGHALARAQVAAGRARIEVEDDGRGLTIDEVPRLFRPFSQVHQRSEVKERGTGLGLYNAKAIVEAHGGTIGVTSAGLGKGSTFWFELPLTPTSPTGAFVSQDPGPSPTA